VTLDDLIEVYRRFRQPTLNFEATESFETSVKLDYKSSYLKRQQSSIMNPSQLQGCW